VRAAAGIDVLITGPTPHGVIVGAAVLSVGITVVYLACVLTMRGFAMSFTSIAKPLAFAFFTVSLQISV
jgi:hypothetical protein